MCLSTVMLEKNGTQEKVCEYVSNVKTDGKKITLVDVMGNETLVEGIKVLAVCKKGRKIKDLTLLNCKVTLEYDLGIDENGEAKIRELFSREEVIVPKKTKNGIQDQNIIPMIKHFDVCQKDGNTLVINALICCQNPTLNPMQMVLAIQTYLPELEPSFSKCSRLEVYDDQEKVFR